MTDPIAVARAQLEEITQLLPEYRDWLDLTGLRGHRLNLAAVTTLTGSPVETAILHREREQAPLDTLEEVAAEWGWQTSDGDVTRYLLNRIDKASSLGLIIGAHLTTIQRAHTHITRLILRPAPGPTCPLGPDHTTTQTDTGYTCRKCDTTRTPDEHKALTAWVARQAGHPLTPRQAATIYHIPIDTIYSWIRRGHLSRTPDGHLSMSELNKLVTQHPE